MTDLEDKNEWKNCIDITGVRLPTGYYFGASAGTGDLSGKFRFTRGWRGLGEGESCSCPACVFLPGRGGGDTERCPWSGGRRGGPCPACVFLVWGQFLKDLTTFWSSY